MKKTSCVDCGGRMKSGRENYRYKESGLSNVVLLNVEVRRCRECGEEEVVLPRIEELHRVLAVAVAEKAERLVPEEIRFLRKYLGWSGVDFAAYFGVKPETVSRWENGAKRMSLPSERFLRFCALAIEPIEDYSILLDMAAEDAAERRYRLALSDHWVLSAA